MSSRTRCCDVGWRGLSIGQVGGTTTGSTTMHNGNSGNVELARAQQERWDAAYARTAELHGVEPSAAVRRAVELFGAAGIVDVLELGAGHGRDALFLARHGFSVHATDFSETALDQLRHAAQREGLDDRVTAALHDVRDPLPPADATVNAVFANLLLNMAFSPSELRALVAEIHRVLCPGGVFVYAVWSADDPCAQHWPRLEDGLSGHDGFVGRFFDKELVGELAENWSLDEVTPYEEGQRLMLRVTMTKAAPES
ncbi:class I SAM-dependent methyltransferase [Kribbella sp. NPDC059898]|uniref:class I SAM-dependent methyltransferase n=1 Tax=Kribbella sp. NPDC059898 TaxID=3346995 RepID=UPI00366608DD